MNAKEYLMSTDKKIYEAEINGYDIRLEEAELLAKMELYAEYKLNNLLKPVVSGWVAVTDKLPEVGQWLLVYAKESGRHIAWYNGHQWEDRAGYNINGVSHWMSIPEPPFR